MMILRPKFQKTAHFDLNDEKLDKVRFFKVNSYTPVGGQLAPKTYVDQNIDEPKLGTNKKRMTLTIIVEALYHKLL